MSVVVIGAGISGLSAAWELVTGRERPVPADRVTVLEASSRVGGVVRRSEVAGQAVDVGAESLLTSRPEALALVEELGLGHQIRRPSGVPAAIWTRGGVHRIPPGNLMGVPSDAAQAAGLLTDSEVSRATDAGSRWSPVRADDISVGELVGNRLGQAVVDRLVEPLLGGVYAGHADQLSAKSCLPRLWSAARDGRSLTEVARASGAARRRAAERSSAHGELAKPPTSPFATLTGGLGRLPEELARALSERGVHLRLNSSVTDLTRTDDGWVVTLGDPEQGEVQRLPADQVVVAVPAPAAARILAGALPAAASALSGIPTATMAVVTFAFPVAGMPDLRQSGFLVPPVEGRTIKAATFTSAKWPHLGEQSPNLVFLRTSVGRAGEEVVANTTSVELARQALADVDEAVQLAAGAHLPDPVEAFVQRWFDALPQYTVGHSDRIAAIRSDLAGVPGLALAGSAYDGVGIPACIATARAAAHRLARGERLAP